MSSLSGEEASPADEKLNISCFIDFGKSECAAMMAALWAFCFCQWCFELNANAKQFMWGTRKGVVHMKFCPTTTESESIYSRSENSNKNEGHWRGKFKPWLDSLLRTAGQSRQEDSVSEGWSTTPLSHSWSWVYFMRTENGQITSSVTPEDFPGMLNWNFHSNMQQK